MSTSVLLSIKPIFANKIFNGQKRYEFRKSLFRDKNVNKVFVYASAPISQVIGEFYIDEILKHDPETLWHKTHQRAGISKEYFDIYFDKRDIGYAIKIGYVQRYETPLDLNKHFSIKQAPQSFVYVNESVW